MPLVVYNYLNKVNSPQYYNIYLFWYTTTHSNCPYCR